MTKEEAYISEYSKMNHAYNQIFDSLQVLLEADSSDDSVLQSVNYGLNVLNAALDEIKASKDKYLFTQKEAGNPEPQEIKKSPKIPKGWKLI